MAVYAYNLARVEARDAKRKSDLKQIQKALELYYDDFGAYPSETACDSSVGSCSSCPCAESDWNYTNVNYIGRSLRDNDILKDLPLDPTNDTTYHYRYEPDCNHGRCPSPLGCCYYDLRVRLEKTGAWHILTGGRY
jgi:hypothetical protein